MRVLLASLLIATLLSVAAPSFAHAHTGTYYVTAGNGLNMRTYPNGSSRIKMKLPYRTAVNAIRHNGNWVKVAYNGVAGWVAGSYISKSYPGGSSSGTSGASGYGTCFDNTWGQVICAPQWIADNIANAAAYYGVSYSTLMRLAACESDYVTDLVSWAGAIGVFQFLPDTFYDFSSGDVWSVHDQAYAAARAISRGYGWYWDCWGR